LTSGPEPFSIQAGLSPLSHTSYQPNAFVRNLFTLTATKSRTRARPVPLEHWLPCLAFAVSACGGSDLVQPAAPALPRVAFAQIAANLHNTLSAVVTFNAEQADSARVVFVDGGGIRDSTPFVLVTGATDTIVTLGLRAATSYRNVVEVKSGARTVGSDTLAFTTGSLPDLLQRVTVTTTATGGPDLTLTSVQVGDNAVFAVAFDSGGTIRWYRQFDGAEAVAGELKQQRNGRFTLYRGTSTGVETIPGEFTEFTPAGDSLRAVTVAPPRYLDNHELWITTAQDGSERFHFFTYDRRTADLTSVGGAAGVSLGGHQLVRQRPDGTTEFEWNSWDHLTFDEWIEPPRPDPAELRARDFDHPNSLAFDRDGNYIVSFRNLGQVMKIDAATGAVMWRVGGLHSDVAIVNDPLGGFSAQHSARMLPDGNLILLDNGTRHVPPETRAVEYALDFGAKTATMVWEFRHVPAIYNTGVGLVQRLRSGNTFIAYAQVGHATEVAQDGSVRWEVDLRVDGKPAFVYRMVRIASLYEYRDP
jgi:arylsulfotransferase ASST